MSVRFYNFIVIGTLISIVFHGAYYFLAIIVFKTPLIRSNYAISIAGSILMNYLPIMAIKEGLVGWAIAALTFTFVTGLGLFITSFSGAP